MSLTRGDKVKITNKNDIEGEVVGFYSHTMGVLVKTSAGHEWIVNPVHLKRIPNNPEQRSTGAIGSASDF